MNTINRNGLEISQGTRPGTTSYRDPRFARRRMAMVSLMARPARVRPFIELARPARQVAREVRQPAASY